MVVGSIPTRPTTPKEYAPLFVGHEQLLPTHRGWDPGALLLAREMAERFAAPLYYDETTRLLVDLNRSVGTPDLHSEATRHLSLRERRASLEAYYHPHRGRVDAALAERGRRRGDRVVHVASHSFTPELHGQVRTADIGLLYDPRRPGEVAFATAWMEALRRADPTLRLRRNYPYLGKSDGVAQVMRRRYPPERYVGIELEVNQRYVEAGGPAWPKIPHERSARRWPPRAAAARRHRAGRRIHRLGRHHFRHRVGLPARCGATCGARVTRVRPPVVTSTTGSPPPSSRCRWPARSSGARRCAAGPGSRHRSAASRRARSRCRSRRRGRRRGRRRR